MTSREPDRSARRWWALAALTLSVLIVGLDGTIINVALPTLSDELGATSAQLQWIGGGYLLALSVGMLPAGLLGDRFGHRRLLMGGIALFGLASAAGALAGTAGQVIAARAVLGLGAAMITPLSMAILPRVFGKDELPRAIGVWTAATAVGMPIGPLVGGWLLDHFWWGSVFLFNVPVTVLAVVACMRLLPADNPRAGNAKPFDYLGTLLGTLGITVLVYGTIQVPGHGWSSPSVLAPLAAGAVLLVLFVRRQRRTPAPLVDLGLFADGTFRWGSVITVFVNFAVMGLLFVVPQYLQAVLGNDAFGSGLRLLPLIGGLMAAATLAEPLVPRLGARVVIPAGLLLLAGGALLGATTGPGDGYALAAVWLSMAGLGFGLAVVPATSMVIGSLPEDGPGTGTSLLETIQQLGGVLGVAALGSVLNAGYLARLSLPGLPDAAADAARGSVTGANAVAERFHDQALLASAHGAFVHGMDLTLLVCAAAAVLAAGLALAFLPGRSKTEQPARTATATATAQPETPAHAGELPA
ncbi:MFS transporter [Actinomadura napierensis]|uniref:DHA2 family efflux MFS transporter permease subunit n=1 Tax=Actinomadura napierensis TaxID=267854 RepID=A0ABN2ZCK3_9ACTN